ncbi:unnamed protein product [Sphagnum compactum]
MHWDSKSLLHFVFNNQRYLLKQRWQSVMLVLLLLLLLTYNKGNLGQLDFQIWGKCSACCPEGCHKDAINYHDSYHVSMARYPSALFFALCSLFKQGISSPVADGTITGIMLSLMKRSP